MTNKKVTDEILNACYDLCQKKQSLKKMENEFGVQRLEFGIPWDLFVPNDFTAYCCNDVIATEAISNHNKEV